MAISASSRRARLFVEYHDRELPQSHGSVGRFRLEPNGSVEKGRCHSVAPKQSARRAAANHPPWHESDVALDRKTPPPAQGMRVIVGGGQAADISAAQGVDPPLYLMHDRPRDRKGRTRVSIYDDHAPTGS